MKIIKKLLVLSYNVLRYVMLFFRKVFKKKIGTKESAGLGKNRFGKNEIQVLDELPPYTINEMGNMVTEDGSIAIQRVRPNK